MDSDQKSNNSRNKLDIIVPTALVLCCAFLWFVQAHHQRSGDEWNEIPGYEIPDFALEFSKTVDPVLGYVPYEHLRKARKYTQQLLKQKERAPISGVTWEERGPNNIAGRTRALMFDPNDMNHKKVWAGGVGGGLWWTADITASSPVWNKVDDFWDNIAITTIAYDPVNTDTFYVGTGEGWFNGGAQVGSGIWKSVNGGGDWTRLTSTDPGSYDSNSHFHWIQKIIVKANGYVFAATRAYDSPFNNSEEGGIIRSTDGGTSWTKVLSVCPCSSTLLDRGADIEIAANGDVYASIGIKSNGKLYKSVNADNGALGTWMDLSDSIEIGNARRIELACAPSEADVIYAVADIGPSGLNDDIAWFKKSADGGLTWSTVSIPRLVNDGTTHFTNGQANYDLILAVHPTNPDFVIAGGRDLHRTTDGGMNWTGISHYSGGFSKPYVHADQHAIEFSPEASDTVLFGNDDGIAFSPNAGDLDSIPTFTEKNTGYNVTQFYSCGTKNEANSHYFLAGSQDNGTQKFTQPLLGNTSLVQAGDGGFCHIDQNDPNIQLAANLRNLVYRSLDGGSTFSILFNQNTGLPINPSTYDSDRKILYASAANNKLKRVSGVDASITNVDLSVSVNGQISALKLSQSDDVLFFGMKDITSVYKLSHASTSAGNATLVRIDNGTTPIMVNLFNLGYVSSIDIGADTNHILVTYSNYGSTSVWETIDGGDNWYSKEGNLPDMPVRWALYNPDNRDQVLLATELGVWSTDNFHPGTSNPPDWGPTDAALANTRCDMLVYRPADKLVAVATHGRGLFTSTILSNCQLVVDQTSGSGVGSLPAAVSCASSGDTIRLSASLAGQTIDIGASPVLLDKNLVIQADGTNISVTGSGTRIFELSAGAQVELSNLVVIAGTSMSAGAIDNPGTLKLNNVTIRKNPGVTGATLIKNTTGAQINVCGNCLLEQQP